MAARNEPSRGGKPDKLMRDALMLALNREASDSDGKPTKKLNLIADKLVELAVDGDIQAIKEVADRVDGKPPQTIAGDPERPLIVDEREHIIGRILGVAARGRDTETHRKLNGGTVGHA